MPMITVVNKESGKKYLFLGTGYGMWKTATASVLFGDWAPNKEDEDVPAVAVMDRDGDILWFHSTELRVVTINGMSPGEAFEKIDP